MPKSLIFDAGPVISLTTNSLLWILESLKAAYNGTFIITDGVQYELIKKPLLTKEFKFEALQVARLIKNNTLTVAGNTAAHTEALSLLDCANNIFNAHGRNISIVQYAEMETIAEALRTNADAVVIDERITRTLIENPSALQNLMQARLHTKLNVNKDQLYKFAEKTRHIKIIRSVELATIAFEHGLLDQYITSTIPHAREQLLESLLWGLKLHGCAVSEEEIKQLIKLHIRT